MCDPAVLDELLAGRDAVIVDGGVLGGGPPSTLVALGAPSSGRRGLTVLRRGRYPMADLRRRVPGLPIAAQRG